MRINSKTYPILEKLENNSLGNMPVFEKDKPFFDAFGHWFTQTWKFCNKDFKKEINIISESFNQASIKAERKLIELYGDIVQNNLSDFDVNGTYILGDFVYMIKYQIKKDSQDSEMFFYQFDKNGIPLLMFVDSSEFKIYQNTWISKLSNVHNMPDELASFDNFMVFIVMKVIALKMFKSYAQVETKILAGKSKIKGKGYKHLNETNLEICFLDSKWFTNLVKSESFNVSGHFRLQPKKKEGSWTKELIWIDEFVKNGYTSKARILTNS
jgi:hypothetical protein